MKNRNAQMKYRDDEIQRINIKNKCTSQRRNVQMKYRDDEIQRININNEQA